MSDVADRLSVIEARGRENWPTSEDVATLAAAVRAVLALMDERTVPDGHGGVINHDVPQYAIERALATALGGAA